MHDYNAYARTYWWAIAAAGYAFLAYALYSAALLPTGSILQIALATIFVSAVAFFPVEIPGTKLSVAGGEIFIFLALLLFGPEAAAIAAAVEGAIGAVRSSKRWTSWFGTPAMATIATAVSGYAFVAASGAFAQNEALSSAVMILLLTAIAILYCVLSNLLPSLLLSIKRGERLDLLALIKDRSWMAVAHVFSAGVAGLLYYAGANFGIWVAFAVSPTIILSMASAHFLFGRAEAERRAQAALLEAANQESERAQAHATELMRSQARFHGAFTNAAIGMALVSATGEIRQVNPAVCRMLGRGEYELLRSPLGTYMRADDFRMLMLDVATISGTSDSTLERELTCIGKSGEDLAVGFSVAYFGNGTDDPDLIVQMQDIRERKQAEATRNSLEAQLRESQKMQAIGTLAGGIAHDFNNIIATILGNTELAREDVSANPRAVESLEEIRKAGVRARALVQQILSFSRRQPTERKQLSLAGVVEESVRLLRATLPARVALEVHREAGVPMVLADATQIQQVILNLATNAMQAMHGAPGRIVVRLDSVARDAAFLTSTPALRAMRDKCDDGMVRLSVSDDGPGMDAATLERIFEPFFTTKPVDEGTGLGLAVVHGIVHGHEGAIIVESEPGKGASFTIYLPPAQAQSVGTARDESAPGSVSRDSTPPGHAGGPHILYLDDDPSLVFLIERMVERRGCRVSGFSDQGAALAALRAKPADFDLVVSDYNMPDMSGLDVARAVRDIRADLPVVIASGFIDETLRSEAAGAGVRELIFKANAEELCNAFIRVVRTETDKAKPGASNVVPLLRIVNS